MKIEELQVMFAWNFLQAIQMCSQIVWCFNANLEMVAIKIVSNDDICAIMHSSKTINFYLYRTFAMSDALEVLNVILSINRMFNGNFIANWTFFLSCRSVTTIPNDARAKVMLFCDRIAARINLIRNVLPVPLGAFKKISPNPLLTYQIIWS